MAMGRRAEQTQEEFWIVRAQVRPAPSHPFYQKLNQLLAAAGFDRFAEAACEKFYAKKSPRRLAAASWAGRRCRRGSIFTC